MNSKFPSIPQWKQIFKVFGKKEKTAFLTLCLAAIGSLIFLTANFYVSNTSPEPAFGGKYAEGIVGQPRFVNPIYGETNDIDRALIDLVFSGLMSYDNNGQIVKDLADTYKISENGKIYEFIIKDNVFWHDGKPLTSDDVIFTIKTIQNSDYKSSLRANWVDVDVEKISDKSLKFAIKSPYNSFLENLTVKIMPKHIWENVSPENFTLSPHNLQPIGSGPYKFAEIEQAENGFVKKLNLKSNRRHYNKPSFISELSFNFYENAEELVAAANSREIDGFSLAALDNNQAEAEQKIRRTWFKNKNFSSYSFYSPRYFAVFFNLAAGERKSGIFADGKVRKAMVFAADKNEIIQTIKSETKINILSADSPIVPDFFSYQQPSGAHEFSVEKAKTFLDEAGFEDNGSGFREKNVAKTPAFQFKSYLKVGSKGTETTQIQKCLASLSGDFKNLLEGETSGIYGKTTENAVTEFQKKYLPDASPTGETGPGTRKKLNEICISAGQNSQPLKFTLTTVNQPQLVKTAELLKKYWQAVGAQIDINVVSLTDLKPIIKDRNYDALLYGEALGAEPDPYPFWHSSQKIDPGLNLSSYENKEIDQLLKDARETLDKDVKKEKLEKMQNIIIDAAPALFLYNPDYVYWALEKVKGIETAKIIDPAKRFSNITNWYIKTKREWK